MSRTYRRKSDDGYCQEYYSATEWRVLEGTRHYRRVRLEGKELKKALARYHSDHDYNASPTPWWRTSEWSKLRAKEKQELIRWMKNPDYEVQMHEQPKWPWWD